MISFLPPDKRYQFDKHAQFWNLLSSPLRPCAEDMVLMRKSFDRWYNTARSASPSAPLKALLLGVTPEIATQDWGVPVDMTAVDISQAMIDVVWPGDTPMRRALCADWLDMPVAEHDCDMILADGIFSLFIPPSGYIRLAQAICRCVKHDGIFLMRTFCRPAVTEAPENIFDDLWNKRIVSFHAFKWRLLMAIQGDNIREGVAVVKSWEMYHRHVGDHDRLAQATGWPIEQIETIDAYRHSSAVYTFPGKDELVETVSQQLRFTDQQTGHYELADCCPMLSFQPR